MLRNIFIAAATIGLVSVSDYFVYNLAHQTAKIETDNKWRAELIAKNFAGYGEKDGNWSYLKDTDILLRLLIQYNTTESPGPKKESFKLKMDSVPQAINNEKDFLAENDKFSLIAPAKQNKKK